MINSTNEIFTTVIKKKNFQQGFTFELTLFNGITEIFFFHRRQMSSKQLRSQISLLPCIFKQLGKYNLTIS